MATAASGPGKPGEAKDGRRSDPALDQGTKKKVQQYATDRLLPALFTEVKNALDRTNSSSSAKDRDGEPCIRREFYWVGGSRKRYAVEDRKRVFSAGMGNLHAKRRPASGCFGECVDSYCELVMEIFRLLFGLLSWIVVKLLFFIAKALFEPIYSRLPCFNVPDGARRSITEWIMSWLLIIAICAYGYTYVFKGACDYDPNCISFRTGTGAFVLAKAFGKAVTASFIIGMIFVLKPVTEYIETLPFQQRWGVGWRTIHMRFMNLALIFAFAHFAAHTQRQRKGAKLPDTFEFFQLVTGLILFGLWFVAGSPLWFRRFDAKFSCRKLCVPCVKLFEWCSSGVTSARIRVTYKGNVEWYNLRNDRPFDDLRYKLRLDKLAVCWVYGSKDHTLRAVKTNEELHDALQTVRAAVIRLDASALDILEHGDIKGNSPKPRKGQKNISEPEGIEMDELKGASRGRVVPKKSGKRQSIDGKAAAEEQGQEGEKGELSKGSTGSGRSEGDGLQVPLKLGEEEVDKKGDVQISVNGSSSYSKKRVKIIVSFENEAHHFHLRLAKPWDDLIIGLKETFIPDHEDPINKDENSCFNFGCFGTRVTSQKLDKIEALFFDMGVRDQKGNFRCVQVDSNEALAAELETAKNPRLIVSPKKSQRRRGPPKQKPMFDGCPVFGKPGNRDDKAYFTRWAFRWTHVPMFYLVAIVYTIHSSDIFPLIAILLWTYTYRSRVLPVEKILYSFSHAKNKAARYANINNKYLLNLRIKLANRVVPDKYGYYVVLGRDTRLCSYTMVPAEGGTEIRLTIKHCTFIDSVLDQIAANENTVDVEELEKTGQTWYTLGRKFFKVYGPFMSCDHTIANAERVAVLVQTTGSVVADTVISFQKYRRYWDKVIVFAVGSDLMNYDGDSIERNDAKAKTTVFTHTDISNANTKQGRYSWILNRISREIKDTHPFPPRGFYDTPRREDNKALPEGLRKRASTQIQTPKVLLGEKNRKKNVGAPSGLTLQESQLVYRAIRGRGPFWPNTLTFPGKLPEENEKEDSDIVVIGLHRIYRPLAEYILKQLQIYNYNVLVCSGAWAKHIDAVLEEDKFDPEENVPLEKLKLHLELFGD